MEVLDVLRLKVLDAEPDDNETDGEYVLGEDYDNNDGDDGEGGGGGDNLDCQKSPDDVNANKNDDVTIILNPAGPDHDGPIAEVVTRINVRLSLTTTITTLIQSARRRKTSLPQKQQDQPSLQEW